MTGCLRCLMFITGREKALGSDGKREPNPTGEYRKYFKTKPLRKMKTYYYKLRKMQPYFAGLKILNATRRKSDRYDVDSEMFANILSGLDIEFYDSKPTAVPVWIRITLPFAFILAALMILFLPINFIITGFWGYKITWVTNWFRALKF